VRVSAEENRAVVRGIYDVINTGDLGRVDALIAPDVVDHEGMPGMPPGVEGFRWFVRTFRDAFPDLRMDAERVISEGDMVATRFTMRGTHRGAFMGIPPTGKQITVAGMDMMRIAGGKAVEHWGQTDSLGMLQQLGAIPAPGQA
jgi:steroid delta-isomerase-like uncharacterized protein